mmetsp:Transcript_5038/g.6141  ORF Transcript_5038/g.6141 Transcript_5038/m.6141 type:complete len:96 (+) Transcript_5038:110-397(+)
MAHMTAPSVEKRPSVAHSFRNSETSTTTSKVLTEVHHRNQVLAEIETKTKRANYQSVLQQVDTFLQAAKKETKKAKTPKRASFTKFSKTMTPSRF